MLSIPAPLPLDKLVQREIEDIQRYASKSHGPRAKVEEEAEALEASGLRCAEIGMAQGSPLQTWLNIAGRQMRRAAILRAGLRERADA